MSFKIISVYFKKIWVFAKQYKTHFIILYSCLLFELVLKKILPLLLGKLVNQIVYDQKMTSFIHTALFYCLLLLIDTMNYSFYMSLWQYIDNHYVMLIRLQLFHKMVNANAEILSNIKTGDFITTINEESHEFFHIIQRNVFRVVNAIISIIVSGVILFFINKTIFFVMLIGIPISFGVSRILQNKIRTISFEYRDKYGKYISWLYEVLRGIKEIRFLSGVNYVKKTFVTYNTDLTRTKIKDDKYTFYLSEITDFVYLIVELCLFSFAVHFIANGSLTIGTFIAIMEYYVLICNDLKELIGKTTDLYRRQCSIDRIVNALSVEQESEEGKEELKISKGEIVFKDVSFRYQNNVNILNNINVGILPGKHTCIVGLSGVGKSTIASLITGFYNPQSGKILIDGQDISKCKYSSIRKQIGLVQQENILFDGTIRYNLLLARPDCKEDELWRACDKAYISDFIKNLPEGLDTMVGEDGIKLSSGQVQRLAIARIFVKNPAILILDEATSALDEKAEDVIHKALDNLYEGRTIIMISHRLSSVINSDRVIVLYEGQVVGNNHHEILRQQCYQYQQMFEKQYINREERC